jgi:thiol-disulfide isomerase/thioredoxin
MHLEAGLLTAALLVATAPPVMAEQAGRVAPNCSLTPLGDGPPWELQELRGRVVWLDFWASWCSACAEALPFLDELDREFPDEDLQIVGINVDEDPEDAREFLARHPVGFRLAVDPSRSCPRDFDLPGMPTAFLIDRSGVIRYVHLGFRPGEAEGIREQVRSLLAEDPADAGSRAAPRPEERHDGYP